jgi:hypothetical protein
MRMPRLIKNSAILSITPSFSLMKKKQKIKTVFKFIRYFNAWPAKMIIGWGKPKDFLHSPNIHFLTLSDH